MTRPMRTARPGLDLIKSFEGFRARSTPLESGRWIIGYGHTQTARPGLQISQVDAANVLRHHDLPPIEAALGRLVLAPLNQNQFDALASFCFNLGVEVFRGSDVLAHVNSGEPLRAACAMGAWRKSRVNGRLIVVDALVRRRAMERALFLEPPRGRPAAPSAIIRPERDDDAGEPRLSDMPHEVDTSGPAPKIVTPSRAPAAPPAQRPEPEGPGSQPPFSSQQEHERTSEDVARRIGERVTRILNDSPGPPPDRKPRPSVASEVAGKPSLRTSLPPSADDIAAAVAALAGPQETGPPPASAPREPALGRPVDIDDIAPINLEDIPGLVPEPIDRTAMAGVGVAALLGIIVALWGFGQVGRVASGQADFTDEWQMLIGPFAVVLGSVLAAVMAFYLIRTVIGR